jgi:hypothetical protein
VTTIQIDTGQLVVGVLVVLFGVAVKGFVDSVRQKAQHEQNTATLGEIKTALGLNGEDAMFARVDDMKALQSMVISDHALTREHAGTLERHTGQIAGLRRDVDELRGT